MLVVDIMADVDVLDNPEKQSELVSKIIDSIQKTKNTSASMILNLGLGTKEYQFHWMIYPDTKEEILLIGSRIDLMDLEGEEDTYYRFIYPDKEIRGVKPC